MFARDIMIQKGLTVKDLAKMTGYATWTIYNILNGQGSPKARRAVAMVLETPVSELEFGKSHTQVTPVPRIDDRIIHKNELVCLNCPLDDCDEENTGCLYRQGKVSYYQRNKVKKQEYRLSNRERIRQYRKEYHQRTGK